MGYDHMLENGMIATDMYGRVDAQQYAPKVIGYCEGCGSGIEEGDPYLDLNGEFIHDDAFCCQEYVSQGANRKVAGFE